MPGKAEYEARILKL